MSKQLPMVSIAGRPYQVDTKRELLRSLEDPKTIIPFDRTLVANHEVYIAFERASGRPYSGKVTKETFENPGLRIEAVPQRLVFPEAEKTEAIPWPRDPMINIYGTVFKLDYNGRRLEEVGKPENAMLFDDMLVVRSDQLTFWYDQDKKTIFKGSVLDLESNPDIIKVQILPFYRVKNLTPVKEDTMQTLMDIARSLKEQSMAAQPALSRPEVEGRQKRRKRSL